MMLIGLTQNQVTVISNEDSDLVNYKWCALLNYEKGGVKTYTAARTVYFNDGSHTTELIHRVVLSRVLCRDLRRGEVVDHIDHDTLNNQRENLRLATPQQNSYNMLPQESTASGFKGVVWHNKAQKWRARISINGVRKSLGLYSDLIEAAKAYDSAAREHFGEFAYLNFREDING